MSEATKNILKIKYGKRTPQQIIINLNNELIYDIDDKNINNLNVASDKILNHTLKKYIHEFKIKYDKINTLKVKLIRFQAPIKNINIDDHEYPITTDILYVKIINLSNEQLNNNSIHITEDYLIEHIKNNKLNININEIFGNMYFKPLLKLSNYKIFSDNNNGSINYLLVENYYNCEIKNKKVNLSPGKNNYIELKLNGFKNDMGKIFFMRHGFSMANYYGEKLSTKYKGIYKTPDPELHDVGLYQTRSLNNILKMNNIDLSKTIFVTSTLFRAIQTSYYSFCPDFNKDPGRVKSSKETRFNFKLFDLNNNDLTNTNYDNDNKNFDDKFNIFISPFIKEKNNNKLDIDFQTPNNMALEFKILLNRLKSINRTAYFDYPDTKKNHYPKLQKYFKELNKKTKKDSKKQRDLELKQLKKQSKLDRKEKRKTQKQSLNKYELSNLNNLSGISNAINKKELQEQIQSPSQIQAQPENYILPPPPGFNYINIHAQPQTEEQSEIQAQLKTEEKQQNYITPTPGFNYNNIYENQLRNNNQVYNYNNETQLLNPQKTKKGWLGRQVNKFKKWRKTKKIQKGGEINENSLKITIENDKEKYENIYNKFRNIIDENLFMTLVMPRLFQNFIENGYNVIIVSHNTTIRKNFLNLKVSIDNTSIMYPYYYTNTYLYKPSDYLYKRKFNSSNIINFNSMKINNNDYDIEKENFKKLKKDMKILKTKTKKQFSKKQPTTGRKSTRVKNNKPRNLIKFNNSNTFNNNAIEQ